MIAARHVEPEKADDWMDKFSEKGVQTPQTPTSPAMDAAAFKMAFEMRSKTKPQRVAPSAEVIEAAETVFEHHDVKGDYDAIESLTDVLLEDSGPHEANQALKPAESNDARTVRHQRKSPENTTAKSDDGDLDLDL